MRSQTVVWTALPNGRSGGTLRLSVFMMPRLQTDEGGPSPRLSLFPDFANWPATIGGAPAGPLSFTVTFGEGPPVEATPDAGDRPRADVWAAIFDPARTEVRPWQFYDFAEVPVWSFPAASVEQFLRDAYRAVGQQNPTAPFPDRQWLLTNPFEATLPESIDAARRTAKGSGAKTLGPSPDPNGEDLRPHEVLARVLDFHARPPQNLAFEPPVPTLDFHEALSMIKAYPRLMRMLGLVFDLVVPVPAGASGNTSVRVTPTWQPLLTGPGTETRNATPWTNCTLGSGTFQATPRGPDYGNGMLALNDTNRFSVIEVDVDGGAERAAMFGASLVQTTIGGTDDTAERYAPPSLRSVGLSVVWNGWASAFRGLARAQSDKQYQLERSLSDSTVAPPAFDAEDLVRGHRFDVMSPTDTSPAWRSLVGRVGSYRFPRSPGLNFGHADEGAVVAGATQAAGTVEPPLPDLYVHETLARWSGWSLAARRPGTQILSGDGGVGGPEDNPPPPADGEVTTPQLSVTFTPPPRSLPKLRFGHTYRFRARAADLAGNGVPLSSEDDSAATPPVAHLRFEPVVAPAMAPDGPLGPGQGSQYLAILNYSDDSPVAPRGLWLFPPKASQLLAEEHGMFDGTAPGQPAGSSGPPNESAATYNLIVSREHGSLDDPGLPGFHVDPAHNTPYFTVGKPVTPWLPDPLSVGVAMVGLPGEPGDVSVTRAWAGARWPDLEPLLLRLSSGPDHAHDYRASTATAAAVEGVALPPAGVADVALSSALPADRLDVLGMWHWISEGADSAGLRDLAAAGRVWLLSPFRVVRLVHAVRLPLVLPEFGDPHVDRPYGSQRAAINDPTFKVDTPSTGTLDVEATWADPLDDPSDPANDPNSTTVAKKAHAFQLTVQDPSRPGPAFAFDEAHGAVQEFGDTKHHSVEYRATATSRFAELFRQEVLITFAQDVPTNVTPLGLNPASVRLTAGGTVLNAGSDYSLGPGNGDITLKRADVPQPVSVSFIPVDTVTGPPRRIEVPASGRPDPPKVVRVSPAWKLSPPSGNIVTGEVTLKRTGGYLRVYLERPWYSSGAGELLGVVALRDSTMRPTDRERPLVTLMGRDPITVSESFRSLPMTPESLALIGTAKLPSEDPRYAFGQAAIGLAEDPFATYRIFPYDVHFDETQNLWYADIGLSLTSGFSEAPLGLFVRLALVRLQPFAIPRVPVLPFGFSQGAEASAVVLATVAQPLPDRSVSVVATSNDPPKVRVTVEGPGYAGWRPPHPDAKGRPAVVQYDRSNAFALHPDTPDVQNQPQESRHTSTIVVEVQKQDISKGLLGDLSWAPAANTVPTPLTPTFDERGFTTGTVKWTGEVPLPQQLSAPLSQPMRLRISEIDFARTMPTSVDASLRRPFIAFIPLT